MTRIQITYDFSKGPNAVPVSTPYTPEQEAEADALENIVPDVPRDPLAEIDALKAALVAKAVISDADVEQAATTLDAQPVEAQAVKG